MIAITRSIALDERELHFDFVRASGPGGQNVNKVSTAVQLRFDARGSPSLPGYVRERLLRLGGRRVTEGGVIVIVARRFRSQEQNRRDALERLVALVLRAAEKPKVRVATKPSAGARVRRLSGKRRRSEKKRGRRSDPDAD